MTRISYEKMATCAKIFRMNSSNASVICEKLKLQSYQSDHAKIFIKVQSVDYTAY